MELSTYPADNSVATRRAVTAAILLVFAVLLVRTAWLNDDAYITFRTVDNFLHGYGLRWNVANRVQTYTHPLWMFTVAGAVAVTGEFYYTAIFLSIALTLATILIIVRRIAISPAVAALAATALALSSAFVDFATSGLEHPLAYLLLTLFFWEYWTRVDSPPRLWRLTLIAALLMTNRIDDGLLVLPALAVAVWRYGLRRSLPALALGSVPFVAWEMFSIVYYGFAVPNTAFAKLGTGVTRTEAIFQGIIYILAVAGKDPLTVLLIAAALVTALVRPAARPMAAGIALYVGYVVWAGGDFMAGRFLANALLCAIVQLSRDGLFAKRAPWAVAMALVSSIGLSAPHPPLTTDSRFGSDRPPEGWLEPNGVNEERAYYYPFTGLLTARRGVRMPHHRWLMLGEETMYSGVPVRLTDAAGFLGFAAGPRVYVLDRWALGDPLLARLPAERPWRIGHYARRIPPGYLETLTTGGNRITDTGVAAYYERLRLITEGPLWSGRRWRAIVNMNLGRYDHFLESYRASLQPGTQQPSP